MACILLACLSTAVASGLIKLIRLVTNLAFYHRFSLTFMSPADNQLGLAVIVVPAIGGIIIGLMATEFQKRWSRSSKTKAGSPRT